MNIEEFEFGQVAGQSVGHWVCDNGQGSRIELTNFGAIVLQVVVPDRNGQAANVNLNFADLAGYQLRHPYFGSTVGRYANRIAAGQFSIDGNAYHLATNNGPNHLHGGDVGFDRAVWSAETISTADRVGVRFQHTSADGDEGYPGELATTVSYELTSDHQLVMDFQATCDQPTHVNLTNHCYWNLAGATSGPIVDHELELAADTYLAVDENLIPTGEQTPVAETIMDFRSRKRLGQDLQQVPGGGYDHCYVLNSDGQALRYAARLVEPKSGRVMEVWTTQPGLQLYTSNFLDGTPESGGFTKHGAVCLEAQHFPDSPNQPAFPTTLLQPGQVYHQQTVHKFTCE